MISLYELDCYLLMFVEGVRMVPISRLTPSGKFLKDDHFNVVWTMAKKLYLSRDGNAACIAKEFVFILPFCILGTLR
jgi:hypothetical protein